MRQQKLPHVVVYMLFMVAVGVIIMAGLTQSEDAAAANDRFATVLGFPIGWLFVGLPLLIAFVAALVMWRGRSVIAPDASMDPFATPDTPTSPRLDPMRVVTFVLFFIAVAVIIIASLIRQ
jgi:TRAP-type C4-dicarboxylate transport system permease small subunit